MSQEQFFQELRTALHREGFTSQPEQDEMFLVEWDGLPLCRVTAERRRSLLAGGCGNPRTETGL